MNPELSPQSAQTGSVGTLERAADSPATKGDVHEFWNRGSCGEIYASGDSLREQLERQAGVRYELEPYLPEFAQFADGAGKDVLEVGVGMGADHCQWARSGPRSLTGIDLTARAIGHVTKRLDCYGLASRLFVGDAENLPFPDNSFDLVYSWGVLHHTPDTPQACNEVWRVLRPGGEARVMIYHTKSVVGAMLWVRYALLKGRPWRSMAYIYDKYLESPGTKAYTLEETRKMFGRFRSADVRAQLSFGDLLEGAVGQRHPGVALSVARRLWPRRLIRRWCQSYGLYVLIRAVK
jgi:ubiquinone/menaquinone biosynthesis C-methylase UbiE